MYLFQALVDKWAEEFQQTHKGAEQSVEGAESQADFWEKLQQQWDDLAK